MRALLKPITKVAVDARRGGFIDSHMVDRTIPPSIKDFADLICAFYENDGITLKKRFGVDLFSQKYFVIFVDPDKLEPEWFIYEFEFERCDMKIITKVGNATVKTKGEAKLYERVIVQGEEFRSLGWSINDEVAAKFDTTRKTILLEKINKITV